MYTNIYTATALALQHFFATSPYCSYMHPSLQAALTSSLSILMEHNVFHFGNTFWVQLNGTTMGNPVAPMYATVFFAIHEMYTYHLTSATLLVCWKASLLAVLNKCTDWQHFLSIIAALSDFYFYTSKPRALPHLCWPLFLLLLSLQPDLPYLYLLPEQILHPNFLLMQTLLKHQFFFMSCFIHMMWQHIVFNASFNWQCHLLTSPSWLLCIISLTIFVTYYPHVISEFLPALPTWTLLPRSDKHHLPQSPHSWHIRQPLNPKPNPNIHSTLTLNSDPMSQGLLVWCPHDDPSWTTYCFA